MEILKILKEFQISVSILTKSKLIIRDINLFKDLNYEIGVSLSQVNENYTKVFEPHASSVYDRISAIRKIKESGIKTYAFIGPIIPLITDLDQIFMHIGPYIDIAMGESLNLRGINIENFKQKMAGLVGSEQSSKIIDLCHSNEYWQSMKYQYERLCDKFDIFDKGFYMHN